MNKAYLQLAAEALQAKLPDNHGFILLTMEYGDGEGRRLAYISSLKREDAINVLKEWLIVASGPEDWMKHIK